jgi:DNA-binding NarL/FixJ family response regulator
MTNTLNIAIVDDHEMFRSGIKFILSENDNWNLLIEAKNGFDFIEQLDSKIPDLVLMDISMPIMNGFETTKKLFEIHPNTKVIVLSMHTDKEYYYEMITLGVHGFIPKDAHIEELTYGINEVANGKNYFSKDIMQNFAVTIQNVDSENKIQLNDKEKVILSLICNGNINKEIAEKLDLSTKTIEKYRNSLIKKTNTRNTAQLVMFAIKNKLINI